LQCGDFAYPGPGAARYLLERMLPAAIEAVVQRGHIILSADYELGDE
jgi:hypothetical protein